MNFLLAIASHLHNIIFSLFCIFAILLFSHLLRFLKLHYHLLSTSLFLFYNKPPLIGAVTFSWERNKRGILLLLYPIKWWFCLILVIHWCLFFRNWRLFLFFVVVDFSITHTLLMDFCCFFFFSYTWLLPMALTRIRPLAFRALLLAPQAPLLLARMYRDIAVASPQRAHPPAHANTLAHMRD